MSNAGNPRMTTLRRRTVAIAIVGTSVIFAYALLAVLQILVLNPLAAVPGADLAQILADVEAAGESLGVPVVIYIMRAGLVASLALLVLAAWGHHRSPRAVARYYLTLLMLGAPAYFVASFGAGMALADTYGIGGMDHSPWAEPLYATSGIAMVGLAGLWVWNLARGRAEAGPPDQAASGPDVLR